MEQYTRQKINNGINTLLYLHSSFHGRECVSALHTTTIV